MFFCNKRPLGCHVSACVLTSMAFIKTNSSSQINITMFSKLCWPFLNSEIIFSLLDTHKKHFQDKCSLATSFYCPHICWQFWFDGNNDIFLVCSPLGESRERIWKVKFGNVDTVVTQLVKRERYEKKKKKSKELKEKGRKKSFSIFN